METRYIQYKEPDVAAVDLINSPPLFDSFAASIRHKDNDQGSIITCKFHFKAKPRYLRWLLEPVLLLALRHETLRRLKALAAYLSQRKNQHI